MAENFPLPVFLIFSVRSVRADLALALLWYVMLRLNRLGDCGRNNSPGPVSVMGSSKGDSSNGLASSNGCLFCPTSSFAFSSFSSSSLAVSSGMDSIFLRELEADFCVSSPVVSGIWSGTITHLSKGLLGVRFITSASAFPSVSPLDTALVGKDEERRSVFTGAFSSSLVSSGAFALFSPATASAAALSAGDAAATASSHFL
mmetsp:Transcript_7757/g.22746  ORF Transcript_7757/g.22746 Transcript_7757/m.22746 type:complete len:202 (-) Transcript_7757:512-1117(-)